MPKINSRMIEWLIMAVTKLSNILNSARLFQKAVLEIQTKSVGPIEVGKLTRRHWNALNEPIVSDLKNDLLEKIKKPEGSLQVLLQNNLNPTLQLLQPHKR